jgi:hypothetical protein
MSDHSERKSVNSRRSFIVGVSEALVAAAAPTETPFANGHAFFATPPASCDSKREQQFDTSVLIIEGKTYAESKVRSATKPGTG